jgi:hypothetical protein
MKKLKTLFKVVLVLCLILVAAIAGAGFYVIHHPKETWALIERHFLPKDLKVTWQDLQFKMPSISSRHWLPSVAFTDLCVRKQDPKMDFCADRFESEGHLNLEELLHPKIQIHRILLMSKHENYFLPSPNPKKASSDESNFYEIATLWRDRFKLYSKWMDVGHVDIHVEHFELRSQQSSPLVMQFSLNSPRFLESANLKYGLKKEDLFETEVTGVISLQNWMQAENTALQIQAKAELKKGQAQVSDLKVGWENKDQLRLSMAVVLKVAKMTFDNQLSASLGAKSFEGNLDTRVKGLPKPFHDIKPLHATFELPQESGKLWPNKNAQAHVAAWAPLFFVTDGLRTRLEIACKCQIPQELKAGLDAEANLRNYFATKDGFFASIKAKIQSLNNSLLNTNTQASLVIDQKDRHFVLSPQIDAILQLTSFQGLEVFLKEYQVGVPAPLSELDGKIVFKAQGPLEPSFEKWTIPVVTDIDLHSSQQKMDVTSNGTVTVDLPTKWIDVDLKVLLKNIVLQLPPLDPVYGVPKVTPDKRIEIKPPIVAQKKKFPFKLNLAVQVRSQSDDSIHLLYPLAHPWIPIGVSLDYQSGSPIRGKISLRPFEVEYLRRRMTVESFQAELNQPVGNFPTKGRFRINQALYKIYIDVLGTLTKPQVVLSSDPYLDRSDIISVLLYGRPNDQLVSADAKTVGSFDAAVADRAIGLLGLWALSSTPIQSFSYNQLNQQYSAQLKLSDDTSLSVGTNWEQAASLELQKRLSDRWMISAGVEPNEEDQQTRKLRLQWEDRF